LATWSGVRDGGSLNLNLWVEIPGGGLRSSLQWLHARTQLHGDGGLAGWSMDATLASDT
jgi:hypothetical protein